MPPPSKRPGRSDSVPLVIRPSASRNAQPVVVPRSRARMGRWGVIAKGSAGIALRSAMRRVGSAMIGLLLGLAGLVEDDGGLVLGGTGPLSSDRQVWAHRLRAAR